MFYQDKKVLVTGGSGFVGTYLIEELLREGAKIRVPIHRRPMIIRDSRIEIVEADLTREEDCLRVLDGIQYVFHAAGAVASAAVTKYNPMAAITSNLILTTQMLQASWSAGVERFLVFSSSTGYPDFNRPVREEDFWSAPTHPTYFGYGWMRRYLERISEFVTSKSSMKIAIVRPTAVYGRWDNFNPATCHVIPALIRKAVEKMDPYVVWGSGDEVRDFCHMGDLARGCLLMLEKYPSCDGVNIGYGQGATIKEVVNIILKAAGHANAKIEFNTSKPTTIPIRLVDISKAKTILNFEPKISLEDGLTDTVRWYMETGRDWLDPHRNDVEIMRT